MVGNFIEEKIREITNLKDLWDKNKITDQELQRRIITEIETVAKVKATYRAIENWRDSVTGYGDEKILIKLLDIWKK